MSALDKTGLEAATVAVHFAADDKDGTLAEAAVAAYLEAVATTSEGVTEEQTPRVTDAMATAFALGASMGDGKFTSDSPHLQAALNSSKARIMAGISAALEASRSPVSQKEAVPVGKLLDLVRWAHDTLLEINPSNYTHDDVCQLNDASVEVILGLAPILGETHGKSAEWWSERASPSPAPAGEPGIKALEWEEEPNEPGWWTATVEPLRLFYEVRVNGRGKTRAILPGEFWKPFDGDIEAAKAAAQADYETRIRSALHPTPTPVSAPVGVVEKTEHLLQTVGDGIVAMFEQMIEGNWRDDHDHDVKMNVAMMNLQTVVQEVMEFRTEHLGYCAPRARTEVENG